jgi:Ca2+-binding EF-hand superfamily protein
MRIETLSLRTILLGAALAMVGATAGAQPAKTPDPQKIFTRKDANSDGFLTLEEFKTGLKDKSLEKADTRFKKSDADGDGKLSFDEFKAGMQKKAKA